MPVVQDVPVRRVIRRVGGLEMSADPGGVGCAVIRRVGGLETYVLAIVCQDRKSPPAWGRKLKRGASDDVTVTAGVAPCAGAWIETSMNSGKNSISGVVAPCAGEVLPKN